MESNIEESICTFDELKGGGYFIPCTHRVFTDNVVAVHSRRVELNHEAENFVWIPSFVALRDLDIEPNARKTLESYAENHRRVV